ncbi:hypothetical protein CLM76_10885 [Vreelandella venusta]|nr:hypothetical protein CLM76_10885 [Halomonas hydrothermalis]
MFFIYGFIASMFLDIQAAKKAPLDGIEAIVFEPFSVRAFFFIATTGFMLVAIRAFTLGMDEEKASNCKLMRCILVPVSEVGLSAGFIIMGMAMGIGAYFFTLGAGAEGAHGTSVVTFKIAALTAFIIIPIYWVQRTVFARSRAEKMILPIIIMSYIVSIYTLLWISDPKEFWKLSIITGTLVLMAWTGTKYMANKALQRTSR